MKFIPRAPAEGINVSREHPLVEASILTGGIAIAVALVVVLLVYMVDVVVYLVPPDVEARWFSELTSDFLTDENEDDDARSGKAELENRLAHLTDRLAKHWPGGSPYAFRLVVLDEALPNAFAAPGGIIAVTSGLLADVGSENEMAFVLAHELGHFYHRDHLRGMGRGAILGLFLTAIGATDSFNLGRFATELTARGFSRQQEADADRFGLTLVAKEYGHIGGAPGFFERIAEDTSSGQLSKYLSTHPAPSHRIETLMDIANQQSIPTVGPLSPWERTSLE